MNNDRFFGHRFSRQSQTPAEYASALERPVPRDWTWAYALGVVLVVLVAIGAILYSRGTP